MDFGFGFGGSSLPSLGSLGFNSALPPAWSVPSQATAATAASSPSAGSDWWNKVQSLIGDGLSAYNLYSRNDLASQQIKAGQYPTVLSLPGAAPVAGISSSWVMIAILLVVVVLIVRN